MNPTLIVPGVVLLLACTTAAGHEIAARHAYSAGSSGSNTFASAGAGSFAGAGAGAINPAAFWWAGPDSPFKAAQEYFLKCAHKGNCANIPGPFPGVPPVNIPNNLPSQGCNSNGCSFSGSFNVNDKVQPGKPGEGDFNPANIAKNPFLNGEYKGVAISSCSGHGCPNGKPQTTITTTECKGSDCKTNTQHGTAGDINLSGNPFLQGGFGNGGSFGGSGAFGSAGSFGGSGSFGGVGGGCGGNCGNVPQNQGGCSTGGCSGTQNQNPFGSTSFTPSGTGCSGVKGGCKGSSPGYFGGSNSFAGSGAFAGSTTGAGQFGQPQQPGHTIQPGQSGQPGHGVQPGHSGQPGQPGKPYQPGHSEQPGQPGKPYQPGQSGQPGQPGQPGHGQPGQNGQPSFNDYPAQPIPTSYPGQLPSGSQTHATANTFAGSFGTAGTKDYSTGFQPGQTTSQPNYPTQGNTSPYNQQTGAPQPQNGDSCYGQGLICVEKHLCINGFVNNDGDGLLNIRHGEKYCKPNTEVCCQLPGSSGQPHKDFNLQVPIQPNQPNQPNQPGGQSFYTTASHHSSAAAAAAASSSSTSSGTTYYTPNLPNGDTAPRFSTASPKAPQPAYNPQPGVYQPGSAYQPGQTINFGGKDGTSPGVIQVVPDGQTGSRTQAPDLIRPSQTPQVPNIPPSNPDGAASTYQPNYSPSASSPNLRTTPNELNFASTLQGPAYLPPGPSPSPSPTNYSPDLLPPNRPTYPQQPSSQRPTIPAYSPTTPKQVYTPVTTPKPYSPPYNPPVNQQTPGYLPPYSGTPTKTQTTFVTTKRPKVTNGYLPPNQVPSASGDDKKYLPPPQTDKQTDSNIININVIKPDPDIVPAPANPNPNFLQPPTTRRTTEFGQNTTPYPGCAAALKCVTEDFCTAEGVISQTRVILTREQETNRVPLTECSDPESGIIGKCCRDPEYKDPWPSTQLDLFDPERRRQPFDPNQIGSPSNNPNTVIKPGYHTQIPNIPFDSRLANVPVPVDVRPPIETDYSQKVFTATRITGENCGARHLDTNPKGREPLEANFAEIPWQAMILRDTNRSLLCGGAIIRKDVVLTAAHCVENLQANDVLVKGGEWKLGIDEEPKPFQINKVSTIVRHPGYNPNTRLNDIALLILNEKFRSDKNVDTLCLPEPNEDVAKTFQKAKCITTGWGKTILQLNIVNSVMHILGVGIMPGSQCQQQLQQYHSEAAHLYNTNCVCGAPVQPQTDICDVDVGSALACDRGDGRYTLAGIYSWDTGCNPTAQIAGYTKVDTQWIESQLQRPLKELRTEERGFYAQLQAQGSAQDCHCVQGK